MRQSAGMSLDACGRPSRRCVLAGLKHDIEVAADKPATVGWSGPRAASPIASARSSCSPAPTRHERRSGWTLPSRRPHTHIGHPAQTAVQDGHPCLACWTARADTTADAHRSRPHGRTRSSGRLQPPGAIPDAGVIARGARHVRGGRQWTATVDTGHGRTLDTGADRGWPLWRGTAWTWR